DFGFRSFPGYRSFLILCGAGLVIGLWLGLERTRFGMKVRAAVDNLRMAQSVGINTSRLFALTFALGSGLAGLGGALGADILATILFALSADLVLGYAGIVTLGHAAFFGTGAYTAGIIAVHGWGEPITGLLAGTAAAALIGFVSGWIVLRTTGLTLLMQTLVVATLL